ncbi:hypothetical protein ILUMI_13792, partial [Ignelater luminosus]
KRLALGPIATTFDDWMLAHPGQAITLRHIGHLSNKAYENAFFIKKILGVLLRKQAYGLFIGLYSQSHILLQAVSASTLEISYTELSTTQSKKLSEDRGHFNPNRLSTSGQNSNNRTCQRKRGTEKSDSPELLKRENLLQLKKKRKEDVKNKKGVKRDIFRKVNVPNKRRNTKNDRANSSFSNSDVSLDEVNFCSSNDLDLEELETLSNEQFEIGNFVLAKFPTKSLLIHYV